jgi:hypothetical protein
MQDSGRDSKPGVGARNVTPTDTDRAAQEYRQRTGVCPMCGRFTDNCECRMPARCIACKLVLPIGWPIDRPCCR